MAFIDMLTANYHTHTKRCGHATGEDEDYVLEALGHGFRRLGFSDHIRLPGFSQPYTRGEYSLFEDYCDSVNSLKKKYEGQMDIYLGFEAEAFLCFFPYYEELLNGGVIDYLILGNHSSMDDHRHLVSRFANITNPSQLYEYKDLAVKARSTGRFSIFAHPDYFLASIPDFDSDCKKVSCALIEASIAYSVPLEVNRGGIRKGKTKIGNKRRYRYPTDEFFSLVHRYNAPCILGCDAHAPEQLSDDAAEFEAVRFVRRHDLLLLDHLDGIKNNRR